MMASYQFRPSSQVLRNPDFNETPDANLLPGTVCPGWRIRGSGAGAQAPVAACVPSASGNDVLSVEVDGPMRWLRLEQNLPAKLEARDLRLRMRYALRVKSRPLGRVGRVGIMRKGRFRGAFEKGFVELFHTEAWREIDAIVSVPAGVEDNKMHLLVVELLCPAHMRIDYIRLDTSLATTTQLPLVAADVKKSPFRTMQHPISSKLRYLNDEMNKELRHNRLQWLWRTLDVALRLEDYRVAVGVTRHILLSDELEASTLATMLPDMASAYIATGEAEGLLDILTACGRFGLMDDQVALVAHIHKMITTGKPSFSLPSGGVDGYLLNKALDLRPDTVDLSQVVTACAASSEPELYLANFFRRRSPDRYRTQFADYLRRRGLPCELHIPAGFKKNFLEAITFNTSSLGSDTDGPRVSVIIACYNCADTIGYALRSVLNQTHRNIEVLVGDDNSADETVKVLEAICDDPRVRLFRSAGNQGPYNIRNALIARASGTHITFHDADDVALPHRIALQLAALEQTGKELCVGQWIRILSNGHLIAFRDGRFSRMCANSILMTRRIYDIYGPYRSVLCAADSEFLEQVRMQLGSQNVLMINKPLVLGAWGDSSLTRSADLEALDTGFRAVRRREYAGAVGRQRVLGDHLLPEQEVEQIVRDHGIAREAQEMIEI